MRYSSALVLGALALGVAAHPNRHASFHERRKADTKRDLKDVDWEHVAYDLSGVDWSTVFPKQPAVTQAAAPVASPPAAAPPAAAAPSAAAPASNADTNTVKTESVANVADLLVSGDFAQIMGKWVKGSNDAASNGGVWVGSDSAWKGVFKNNVGQPIVLFCWRNNGFTGMVVSKFKPDISYPLAPGASVTLSFAQGAPGACSIATKDTTLATSGAIFNTWWEFNFGPNEKGAFDVSKNTNMKGVAINSVGSKCTSNMNTCVFSCVDSSLPFCWLAGSYKLTNCGAAQGGGSGFDPIMNGVGGGCTMGGSGETVNVTFG